jgi:hypothetical protein
MIEVIKVNLTLKIDSRRFTVLGGISLRRPFKLAIIGTSTDYIYFMRIEWDTPTSKINPGTNDKRRQRSIGI